MKNIFLAIALFVVSLFVVAPVFAVSPKTMPPVRPAPIVVPIAVTKIDYNLPYPGLLPDSPLYFLKQIRDKILEFLISDPVRKIEFYLLQADKRLGMGMMLVEKGKDQLAESTISKGTKYMGLAVALLASAKTSGKTVPPEVVDRLSTAIAKHIEVLESLVNKTSGATAEGLKSSLTLLEDLAGQVAKLK